MPPNLSGVSNVPSESNSEVDDSPLASIFRNKNRKASCENDPSMMEQSTNDGSKDLVPKLSKKHKSQESFFTFETKVHWINLILITLLHIGTIYACYTFSFVNNIKLSLWSIVIGGIAGFGITAGAHRLWTHRAYKAKLPLRIILAACYLTAGQNMLYDWVRDHRVHHKYTETDADPHNTKRGFFFSHVGWLMLRKHPEVLRCGRRIDMSDILADPVVQITDRYFIILKTMACFVLPMIIPVYLWNEEWFPTILSQLFIRYPWSLNATWSVNSFAHFWGSRGYDKSIRPVENRIVAFFAMGEGWHNYHHVFPWDYKTAELGNYKLNITTMLIDGFAKIGWAYDLKTASADLIGNVANNRGDGSRGLQKD